MVGLIIISKLHFSNNCGELLKLAAMKFNAFEERYMNFEEGKYYDIDGKKAFFVGVDGAGDYYFIGKSDHGKFYDRWKAPYELENIKPWVEPINKEVKRTCYIVCDTSLPPDSGLTIEFISDLYVTSAYHIESKEKVVDEYNRCNNSQKQTKNCQTRDNMQSNRGAY